MDEICPLLLYKVMQQTAERSNFGAAATFIHPPHKETAYQTGLELELSRHSVFIRISQPFPE